MALQKNGGKINITYDFIDGLKQAIQQSHNTEAVSRHIQTL